MSQTSKRTLHEVCFGLPLRFQLSMHDEIRRLEHLRILLHVEQQFHVSGQSRIFTLRTCGTFVFCRRTENVFVVGVERQAARAVPHLDDGQHMLVRVRDNTPDLELSVCAASYITAQMPPMHFWCAPNDFPCRPHTFEQTCHPRCPLHDNSLPTDLHSRPSIPVVFCPLLGHDIGVDRARHRACPTDHTPELSNHLSPSWSR